MRSALRHGASALPRLLVRPSTASRTVQLLSRPAQSRILVNGSILRCLHQGTVSRTQASAEPSTASAEEPQLFTKFQELADHQILHPVFVERLTQGMNLSEMTEVQSRTISTTVNGNDCIAQAKTGTGKTIAFLLPILQNIVSRDPDLARRNARRGSPSRTTADDIRAIIISPTRELAEQIAAEAKRLVAGTSIVVQCAVGGTQKREGMRSMQRDGCHILVATPGRLLDILSDPYNRIEAPAMSMLVFDEADRLLEQGFWEPIQEIMTYLPRPDEVPRQTLMFSATVPREVVDLVRTVLKPGFAFEQCVRDDEQPTHERVPQFICPTNGLENQLPAVLELCQREIKKGEEEGGRPFKAIVYFASTNEVAMATQLFRNLEAPSTDDSTAQPRSSNTWQRRDRHPFPRTQIYEIHSRLTQAQRTRASDAFRRGKSAILLSSDVTARGLDFPDVTHVIQVGPPTSAEQYVHRVGRTARAGKEGEAWLFVDERMQLPCARRDLGQLPITRDETLEIPALDLTKQLTVSANAGSILGMVQQAMSKVSESFKEECFRSVIGAHRRGASSAASLVNSVNNLCVYGWGLSEPPALSQRVAQQLGLGGLRELRVETRSRSSDFDRDSPSGGFGDSHGHRRSSGFSHRGSSSRFGGHGRGGYGGSGGGDTRARREPSRANF